MRKVLSLVALSCFVLAGSALAALPSRGEAQHVVLILCDGLRPDFITPQHAPTLYGLATNGVFFKNHHSSYLSTTEVNGTAIATGAYPEHSGIYANSDFRPLLN